MANVDSYEPVMGFEVHVELATKSKMFCGCPADHFEKPANSQTCPTCLGLPGALPVPNRTAILWVVKLGLALGSKVNLISKFDRKNYFYPDLPKGYQISQYDLPFCHGGALILNNGKRVRIRRVHLEEDTAKLLHQEMRDRPVSLIDFNRSGVPLAEVVTEPDFNSVEDGVEYLKEIQLVVRSLQISSADMEKGSMRLEANISMKKRGDNKIPGYKVELKNINSFRFIRKALMFEASRQIQVLENGEVPIQETRGFEESTGRTVPQRDKEEAHDYRYFPEPDIPPVKLDGTEVESIRKALPEMPWQIRSRLLESGLSANTVNVIAEDGDYLRLFDETLDLDDSAGMAESIANYLVNKRFGLVLPKSGADVLRSLSESQKGEVDLEELERAVDSVMKDNDRAVNDYKNGKVQILGFLIGQVRGRLPGCGVDLIKKTVVQRMG